MRPTRRIRPAVAGTKEVAKRRRAHPPASYAEGSVYNGPDREWFYKLCSFDGIEERTAQAWRSMGVVQGHHSLGEYHYFVLLPGAARSLGHLPEEKFATPESFLAFVSAVHESYHVYQSLVLGCSCAVVVAEDRFVSETLRAKRTGRPEDEAAARLFQRDAASLKEIYYEPGEARVLYDRQARLHPRSAAFFRSLPDLTTTDLLECQAALLTEAYVSSYLSAHPGTYNPDRDSYFAPAVFRMEHLERYSRPLKFFRERLGRVLDLDLFAQASRNDPLHEFFPRVAEYKLLAFLLDYALHIPPLNTFEADASMTTVFLEDLNPVVRFIKLVMALVTDIVESVRNPHWPTSGGLDLDNLYTALSLRLAHWIDVNNLLAISENRRMMSAQPSAQSLFPLQRSDVLRALKLGEVPLTFPLPAETSGMWLGVYDSIEKLPERARLDSIRASAMQARKSRPDTFAAWLPASFFTLVGLPTFFRGPNGIFKGPAASLRWTAENDRFDRNDPDLRRFSMLSTLLRPDQKTLEVEGHAGLPYAVLDEIAAREVLLALCNSQMNGESMACPRASGRIAFYGCPGKTERCSRVAVPNELPGRDCIASVLYNRYFARRRTA